MPLEKSGFLIHNSFTEFPQTLTIYELQFGASRRKLSNGGRGGEKT